MFIQDYISNLPVQLSNKSASGYLKVGRRQFLGGLGLTMGVVLTGCEPKVESAQAVPVNLNDGVVGDLTGVKGGDATPTLWITIEPNNQVKITCHRSELGQQVWTSMAQIVVDELEADWDTITIEQALGDKKYGDQNTDGSRSVRYNFHRLRIAGAAMKDMLERAAALKWGVEPAACKAENGIVVLNTGDQKLSYGELTEIAAGLSPRNEGDLTLKTREQWKYIAKGMPSLTVPKIVRGEGQFGIDVQVPGMVYAVVARPPQLFSTLASVNDAETLKVPGVLRTLKLADAVPPALFKPLGGVAVIAKDTWAAIQGREALELSWNDGPNAGYNSDEFKGHLLELTRTQGSVVRSRGRVEESLKKAAKNVVREYYAAHLSQSPMEPPTATAMWHEDGRLECWACVQDPQTTRNTIAQILGMSDELITVHATWLGGGFGRKSKPDYVVEAALISKEVGRPVKVQWTREDDIQHGYYHSVSAQRLEAGLESDGSCIALLHRSVFPPISSTFTGMINDSAPGEMDLGATDTPFDIANLQVEGRQAPPHLRIGWLRSVANIYHAFAVQSFAAELAHEAGMDAKDYLLKLIGEPRIIDLASEGAKYGNYGGPIEEYPVDTARLRNVVDIVAQKSGWGREMPKGHGLGIAVHRSFLTYVAVVIEVQVGENGSIKIPKAWMAADAGTVVNPRHATDQMEGGLLYGLSNALYGSITAKNGVVEQSNFHNWRLMRMNEAPHDVEVHFVESDAPPGGIGEPGTPLAAPALANAIFAATGKRVRSLPILGPNSDYLA